MEKIEECRKRKSGLRVSEEWSSRWRIWKTGRGYDVKQGRWIEHKWKGEESGESEYKVGNCGLRTSKV